MDKENLNQKIGNRLKECRTAKNLTQKELAELSYCTPQTISYIENGKRGMSRDLAHTFSMHLEVNEDYLLCEADFKSLQEEVRCFDALRNECDVKLTNLLQILGHQIKLSFDAGQLNNPDSLIGEEVNFHFDTYSNDIRMEIENFSGCINNVHVQFDDTTISLVTFMDFLDDIFDYIEFLILHLADNEERNSYKIAISDAEETRRKEAKWDSLSKEEKLNYLKKHFGDSCAYFEK